MKRKERIKNPCVFLCWEYAEQYVMLRGNLSRFTGLIIMRNVTLFYVNSAVVHEGCYTLYSLGALAAVEALLIIPHGLFDRLWFSGLDGRSRWPVCSYQQRLVRGFHAPQVIR